jgi:hypothetical protein
VRTFRSILPLLAVLASAAGCGEGPRAVPAPLDRFTWPTGLALVPVPGGGRALVVVSSNFDLRYASQDGGSVLAVDPDRSDGDALVVLGGVRVGSFGGLAATLSGATLPPPAGAGAVPDPAACPGWTGGTQVLVPSRTTNALYRIDVGAGGALTCGEGCRIPLDGSGQPRGAAAAGLADPFAVEVACRPIGGGALEAAAWVSHLRTETTRGWLSRLDLTSGALGLHDAGGSPTERLAYDPVLQRLYATGVFTTTASPLRVLNPLSNVVLPVALDTALTGADLRALALSSDGKRAYVGLRLYDPDLATTFNGRPGDVGGALAVLDLTARGANGEPQARLLRLVPVGIGSGVNEVEVLPRGDGRRDVVAVSSGDDGTVTLYDDEGPGAIAAVLGRGAEGERLFGLQPTGLVSEPIGPSTRRLYVGSFDRGFIRTVDVDLDAPALARPGRAFGREMP